MNTWLCACLGTMVGRKKLGDFVEDMSKFGHEEKFENGRHNTKPLLYVV